MLLGGILILGGLALFRIPVTVSRAALFPGVTIEVEYSGVSPEKIEEILARPVEEAVSTVGAIREIASESEEGKARIHVKFDQSANTDLKSLEIRERIDLVASAFPREVQKPVLLKYDPDQTPVLILLLRSERRSLQELRELGDREIKKLISGIPGISQVFVAGGRDREILVDCDRQKLEAHGLTMRDLLGLLQAANTAEGLGHVEHSGKRVRIQLQGRFKTLDELRKTAVIASGEGRLVRLEDIANVQYAYKEQETASRYDGTESVAIYIYKSGSADLLALSTAVHELLRNYERQDLHFQVLKDQAETFRNTLRNFSLVTLSGLLLVGVFGPVKLSRSRLLPVAILVFVLASLCSVLMLYLIRWQLDLLAIGGAILMLWLIGSFCLDGTWGKTFKRGGVLLFYLLTTAVMLPIMMAGDDFRRIYGSLCVTMSVGFAVGLFLVSILPWTIPERYTVSRPWSSFSRLRWIRLRFFRHESFVKIKVLLLVTKRKVISPLARVRWMLTRRPIWFYSSLLLFVILTPVSLYFARKESSSGLESLEIQARVEMPSGTSFTETDRVAREVEKRLSETGTFKDITTRVESAQATLTLRLHSRSDLTEQNLEHLKKLTSGLDPAFVHFSAESSGGLLDELSIDVIGSDLETLDKIVKDLAKKTKTVSGAGDVLLRFKGPRPEVLLVIDKIKAEQSGISTRDIGELVRYAIQGGVATKFVSPQREVDVRIRYRGGSQSSKSELAEIAVGRSDGTFVPLKEIARQVDSSMPVKIYRKNKKRTFSFSVRPSGVTAGALASRLQGLKELKMPEGYRIEFGKELEEAIERQKKFLGIGSLIFLLVYMLLAAYHEDLLVPFSMMAWLPVLLSIPALISWLAGLNLTIPVMVAWFFGALRLMLLIHDHRHDYGKLRGRLKADFRLALCFFLPCLLLSGEGRELVRGLALGSILVAGWALVVPSLILVWQRLDSRGQNVRFLATQVLERIRRK